jgi:hypothetical protein
MEQQLREAQHVIAQFYQEGKELKRKIDERGSEEQTPQRKIDPMKEMSKDKYVMHKPETTILANTVSPMIRSLARKKSSEIEGLLAASKKPPTSPTKREKNIRWMNKKLREAQD